MGKNDFSEMLYRRRMANERDAEWKASNKACEQPVITSKTKITKLSSHQQEDAPSIFRFMPLGSTLE